MDSFLPLLFGLIGVGALYQTYRHYSQYRAIASVAADIDRGGRTEGETTIHGPIDVTEPATPPRERPAEASEIPDAPALVAWRVRRKVKTGGTRNRSTGWRTDDGGLAVGEFSVLHGGRYVRVDGEQLVPDVTLFDPFDAPTVHLGEPKTETRLGDPDPLTKLLERVGLIGDGGLLSGLEVSISFGRKTLTPDRYQETAIGEGEEIAVQGAVVETDDGPAIRGTDDSQLVLVGGDLEERGARLRRSAGKQLGLAGIMFALAAATPGLLASLGL